jgi:hypothetical protein
VWCQELVVQREEGSGLLHAACTWGDKTLASTNPQGADTLRAELSALAAAWDALGAATSDARVALESRLLQWSRWDDAAGAIERWLRDTERRLEAAAATDNRNEDLGEKKAHLQKLKVTVFLLLSSFKVIVVFCKVLFFLPKVTVFFIRKHSFFFSFTREREKRVDVPG